MTQAVITHPRLRLVYFPEFIRERSRLQWTVCPDRLVLAGEERDLRVVQDAFNWVEDVPILRMSFLEADWESWLTTPTLPPKSALPTK